MKNIQNKIVEVAHFGIAVNIELPLLDNEPSATRLSR